MCVRERERKRERDGREKSHTHTHVHPDNTFLDQRREETVCFNHNFLLLDVSIEDGQQRCIPEIVPLFEDVVLVVGVCVCVCVCGGAGDGFDVLHQVRKEFDGHFGVTGEVEDCLYINVCVCVCVCV
jgi:hypothetical protein